MNNCRTWCTPALGKVVDVSCSFWFLGVPPTLVGKVEGPPTLTKIEKVGGIRGGGSAKKVNIFMCLKRRSEVEPKVIQNFDQNFWSTHLRSTDFSRKKAKIF